MTEKDRGATYQNRMMVESLMGVGREDGGNAQTSGGNA